jgi:hypothetical protein
MSFFCGHRNVANLDPDPHVLGPPGSISQRYGSGAGSFPFLIKALSGLSKVTFKNKILAKSKIVKTEDNVPAGKLQEKK